MNIQPFKKEEAQKLVKQSIEGLSHEQENLLYIFDKIKENSSRGETELRVLVYNEDYELYENYQNVPFDLEYVIKELIKLEYNAHVEKRYLIVKWNE